MNPIKSNWLSKCKMLLSLCLYFRLVVRTEIEKNGRKQEERDTEACNFFPPFATAIFCCCSLSNMPSILPTQINEPPQRKFFNKITSTKNHTRHFISNDNEYDKIPLDSTTNRYNNSTTKSFPLQHHVSLSENSKFLLCCFMWYVSSSLSSNTAKQIMNTFKYPVTLTFIQFLMVACWCALMERIFKSAGIKKPTKMIIQTIVPLSSFMIVGHVFSSISISRIPVSLVHTIKVYLVIVREYVKIKMSCILGISTIIYSIVLSIYIQCTLFISSVYSIDSIDDGCYFGMFLYVFK